MGLGLCMHGFRVGRLSLAWKSFINIFGVIGTWVGYTLFVCIGNAGNGLFGIHGRFGLMLKGVSCLVCFNRVVMTIRGKYN